MFDWLGCSKTIGGNLIGTSPEFELALYTMAFMSGQLVTCDYTPRTNVVAYDYTLTRPRQAAIPAIAAALTVCTSHSSVTRSVQATLALATRSFDVVLSVSRNAMVFACCFGSLPAASPSSRPQRMQCHMPPPPNLNLFPTSF
jgi:hypothetical protein